MLSERSIEPSSDKNGPREVTVRKRGGFRPSSRHLSRLREYNVQKFATHADSLTLGLRRPKRDLETIWELSKSITTIFTKTYWKSEI